MRSLLTDDFRPYSDAFRRRDPRPGACWSRPRPPPRRARSRRLQGSSGPGRAARTAQQAAQVLINQSQDARETRRDARRAPQEAAAGRRPGPADRPVASGERFLPGDVSGSCGVPEAASRDSQLSGLLLRAYRPDRVLATRRAEQGRAGAPHLARHLLQFFAIGGLFVLITERLIWIIRTLVEYRRWHRTSKVHTEVHNKLMDRFTANEDLLAYMQTPAAQRFLESAPLSLDSRRGRSARRSAASCGRCRSASCSRPARSGCSS